MQLKQGQLVRSIFLVLSFAVPVMAQSTFSCPANQYVSSQLVNTGQGCSALPGTTLTGVGAGTAPTSSGTYNFANNPVTAGVLTDTGLAAVTGFVGFDLRFGFCNTEIDDFHFAFETHHHVLRTHIAVDDI